MSPVARLVSLTKPPRKGDAATYPTNWDTRGLRNNNPGNLEHSPAHWVGQSEVQTDPRFVQFDDLAHGVRALGVILRTYQAQHGCKTVSQFITRWAPPSENNTAAYVRDVSAICANVGADDPSGDFDLTPDNLRALCLAICSHENGIGWRELLQNPTFAQALHAGADMALGIAHA